MVCFYAFGPLLDYPGEMSITQRSGEKTINQQNHGYHDITKPGTAI